MDLSKAHLYFASNFSCPRSGSFQGQLLSAPLEASSSYFYLPRRLLKLSADVDVRPSDVVTTKSGKQYLVAENAPSELWNIVLYKTFKLFEITHATANWVVQGTTEDAITGAQIENGVPSQTPIPIVVEFLKPQEDEMRIPSDLVRIITNADVAVGDVINEYHLVNVEVQLGLRFCSAKRQ